MTTAELTKRITLIREYIDEAETLFPEERIAGRWLCDELEKHKEVIERISMARRLGMFDKSTKEYLLEPFGKEVRGDA